MLKSWQHAFYGAGRAGGTIVNLVLMTWAMYYYIPPAGEGTLLMPIGMFGAVMLFGRIVDAVADPLVGHWSDRSNTRWGRRIPFVAFGSLPLVLVFVLLWFPPVGEFSLWNGFYFAIMLGLFTIFYTIVFCPHNALLAEVTGNSKERVAMSTWGALFMLAGTAIMTVTAPMLIESLGYQAMVLVLAPIALLFLFGPVVAIKERPRTEVDEVEFKFIEAIKLTFSNKPFLYYMFSMALFQLGGSAIIVIAPYFVTQVMGGTEGQVAYVMGAHLVAVILFFPLVNKLAARFGKTVLYSAALLSMALFLPFIMIFGLVSLPGSTLVWAMVMFALAGIPMSIIYVLPNAIVADTIDYDRALTGKSRGAMYFGVQGLIHKTAVGLSSVYVTQLFLHFGNSVSDPMGPLGVLLVGPVAALFVFCGFLVFRKFPRHDYIGEAEKKAKVASFNDSELSKTGDGSLS